MLTLLLSVVGVVYSQEWECHLTSNFSSDEEYFNFYETKEMSNGNIAVASSFFYRSGYGDFYSAHLSVALIDSDGVMCAQNHFFRPGYTTMSYAPYLFENENGELLALSTYSPEHDFLSFNYFKNYENPPTDAILSLAKLDDELNIIESYEHSFPIDTFENKGNSNWEYLPNEFSGNLFLFSAIEDEGNIIGAYFKMVSTDNDNPRGHDSLFLFRMNLDGEMLDIKGYERETQGGWAQSLFRRNQMVKTDTHYLIYEKGSDVRHGKILY